MKSPKMKLKAVLKVRGANFTSPVKEAGTSNLQNNATKVNLGLVIPIGNRLKLKYSMKVWIRALV
jgi:hypothetical protein